MKWLILPLVALALAGCDGDTDYKPIADNPHTTAVYNGTIEGCRLYYVDPEHGARFNLAICGKDATTSAEVRRGKTTETVRAQSVHND